MPYRFMGGRDCRRLRRDLDDEPVFHAYTAALEAIDNVRCDLVGVRTAHSQGTAALLGQKSRAATAARQPVHEAYFAGMARIDQRDSKIRDCWDEFRRAVQNAGQKKRF